MNKNILPEVIQGGSNVFEDLGFAPEEALNLMERFWVDWICTSKD